MELVVNKRVVRDKKHGFIFEPYFGRNMVIVYKSDETPQSEGVYKIKLSRELIPAGKDARGVPLYIRPCVILKER